jgi:hypothetical protein
VLNKPDARKALTDKRIDRFEEKDQIDKINVLRTEKLMNLHLFFPLKQEVGKK